jgi:hypothetical protein
MPKDLDLKGKSVMKARAEFERVAREFPTANLTNIHDLTDLDAISQNVELFKVSYPPEVSRLTELAWTKQGDAYTLPVGRERVTLSADLLGEWWIKGSILGKPIEVAAQNLAGAFNCADGIVLQSGVLPKSVLTRDARWRESGPSEKQIALCRKLRIPIPNGANRGQVSSALDAHFSSRRSA